MNRENKANNEKINDCTLLFQMTNTIINLKQGSSKEDWKLLQFPVKDIYNTGSDPLCSLRREIVLVYILQ